MGNCFRECFIVRESGCPAAGFKIFSGTRAQCIADWMAYIVYSVFRQGVTVKVTGTMYGLGLDGSLCKSRISPW